MSGVVGAQGAPCVALPPKDGWEAPSTDAADALLRVPLGRSTDAMLVAHARVLVQWARQGQPRRPPAPRADHFNSDSDSDSNPNSNSNPNSFPKSTPTSDSYPSSNPNPDHDPSEN